MELHINLEGRRDLARQITEQLRTAITQGQLVAGTQLPPTRLLAEQLGVSRKTVADAYAQLTYDNLLVGRVGAGTFVNSHVPQARAKAQSEELAGAAVIQQWREASMPMHHPIGTLRYDYLGGATSKNQFPHDEWRRSVLFALRQTAQVRGLYSQPEGIPMLREAIARHIGFSRGVRCNSDDLLVTNGAQQALDLVARVLVEPGCTVAVEDPGYPPARLLFAAQGAHVVGIPVDDQGIRVELIPDGTRLIYVTPAHQFPLGMPMSLERRLALLERARELGAIIIEDDYDCEFRYEGRPTDCLQSLDQHGLVAYVGTFSKTLLPELRLGYLVAPPGLLKALISAKQLTDWHTATLTQWALAKFMVDGYLLKHIRRCHQAYASRREHLIERLDGDLSPWFQRIHSTAGFHLAILDKGELNIPLLIDLAKKVEVGLYPLAPFYHTATPRTGLLMGYGSIETLDIQPSLDRVREVLRQLHPEG
ncbi:MocR-like pyridoxine biosynthesis transcription factor PdxR [Pseudomonas gingeri]|uniref:MocR-like pyridoxine biosynthesis transcription factor PdxR n=1 Tax=Pseudomonas gingeri TaxID=117681 RepID=UPI0015A1CA1D|nr:PLP-dependent aminotransferase family protein [Pseudomonas gingeri]NWD08921.1 PLP-dependent aminotransferase family protein [Pseudomonas gingeri]NWE36201.1 PLP-dependent aminotransferase family protein [Pseudomonas gingeri]NWE60359.1 PLP-dependent aminotransferase family protein [Pseudomonas gingeri]NWF05863.1 PLP-dependent aminotransferase family protein [Pseudomonas gingeri]